jgi:hypothetical protein
MFPHMRIEQKEIKITREKNKSKIKKKNHKLPELLECSCCLLERSIAQVGALDRTRGRIAK